MTVMTVMTVMMMMMMMRIRYDDKLHRIIISLYYNRMKRANYYPLVITGMDIQKSYCPSIPQHQHGG